jgi:hypothetical protein
VSVPIVTLDELLARNAYPAPYGIKIDTEGFELEVLKGAARSLANIEFIIAEVSVKKRFTNSYRFSDIAAFLGGHGFELIDILNFRPRPQRFFDCLFVRYEHPAFNIPIRAR